MTNDKKIYLDRGFLRHLFTLNQIVSRFYGQSGKEFHCIGNLFYEHNTNYYINTPPVENYEEKRNFFVRALFGHKNFLEVGFNAGHSALLALTSHRELIYTGIDICETKYTLQCADYLAKAFKGRFNFIKGDSREILPFLATHHPKKKFDVFHIDGNHKEGPVRADISNVLRIAHTNSLVILDDINFPDVAKVYDEYIKLGRLRPVQIKSFKNMRCQSTIAVPIPDSTLLTAEHANHKAPKK